jgi:hypothetical protein
MILEGIVTTIGPNLDVNIAPMGPHVGPERELQHFVLRPYKSSTTYRNLKHSPEGVLHVTDDVWLLAQAAIGRVDPEPDMLSAKTVHGRVLADTCRWYEFRAERIEDRADRTTIDCVVSYTGRTRDFFGFNRAKHAIVEAAILATRTEFIPIHEIQEEFRRLSVPVRKTAGVAEVRAFELLLDHINRAAARCGAAALRVQL